MNESSLSDDNNMVDVNVELGANVKSSESAVNQCAIIKEDMGPWMLMSYRNKKKIGANGGSKKNGASGSRYAVLQEEDGNVATEGEPTVKNLSNESTPTIVKLWQSFQEKKKGPSSVIKNKSSTICTANLKHGSSPNKHSSSGTGNASYVLKEKSTAVVQSKSSYRAPMKDVSNFGATSGSKSTAQYQRKSKGSSCSTAKHQPHISKKLSFGSMEDNVFGSGIPAIFGRCPLEEDYPGSSKVPSSNDADSYAEQTFASNSILNSDDNLLSPNGESMVDV